MGSKRKVRLLAAMRCVVFAAAAMVYGADASGQAVEQLGDRLFLVRDRQGSPLHFQMIVQAGCSDEANGCRGLAHYLEHLILVGRNPEHRDIAMRMFADGYANGWTNDRATVFVHRLPSRPEGPRADLERLFGFYAARLNDFVITAEDAERERRVVRQEHDQRVGGQPFSRFARDLDKALLPDHPAGQWTIGRAEDIDSLTLEDARAFHQRWYRSENVFFVVRGDVEGMVLREIADKALNGAPHGMAAVRTPPLAGPQNGRVDLRRSDRGVSRPAIYYRKLVAAPEGDPMESRAAWTILLDFLSSRLPGSAFAELVERRKLSATTPSVGIRRISPEFVVLSLRADPSADVPPEALLAGIDDYLSGLTGVPATIVERLKSRRAGGFELANQEAGAVYDRLVAWIADRNRYEDLEPWPRRIANLTADDLASRIRALAGPGRVATGILTPENAK